MGQVSAKLRRVAGGYAHYCPGCEGLHVIPTNKDPDFSGPNWSFDGNVESPTFNPSVRITYNGPDAGQLRDSYRAPAACCHYFLHDGELCFCGDSTHPLSGKVITLPDLPAHYKDFNFGDAD